MKMFVYIARCNDDSLYTGVTQNLDRRIWQHNHSRLGARSLKGKRPVFLKYFESYATIQEALTREREIKGWKKEKKEKLIALAPVLSKTKC